MKKNILMSSDSIQLLDGEARNLSASLTAIKSIPLNVGIYPLGGALNYDIFIANTSNSITASQVILNDQLDSNLLFSDNSVELNSTKRLWGANPQLGIGLGEIGPNQSLTVSFQVQSTTTALVGSSINNQALISYGEGLSVQTNNISFTVANANFSGRKYVNTTYASVGEIISYSIILENLTSSEITDIDVSDNAVPITGTIKLNGSPVQSTTTLSGGFNVSNIPISAYSQAVLSYDLYVKSEYQAIGYIENSAQMSRNQSEAQPSNTVFVQIAPATPDVRGALIY